MNFDPSKEELLIKNENRFTFFPIKYHDIYQLYKKSLASFWTVEELNFTQDLDHWKNKLNDNERFFIKNILAFFAGSDGIINENLSVNFSDEIQVSEIKALYTAQMMIETIHSETYSMMIDTYITDNEEKDNLFRAIETNPIVTKKASWAFKWMNRDRSFPERLLAFSAIEGIFFSGSFCAIFWLRSRGLMPSLAAANQFISRDESLHCMTSLTIYGKLKQRLPENIVHDIFREAYLIEKEFITESLPVSLIGMNSKLMTEYIEYITDYWLSMLGYRKLFNTRNPFDFMEMISLENKTNFFDLTTTTEYKKAIIQGEFSTDVEF